MTIRITTCQAPIAEFFVRDVANYLAQMLGQPTQFVNDIAWQERQARLDRGELDIGWICGAPYVRRIDQRPAAIELLAAPVMAGARYQARPIYFSDVLVRADSEWQHVADLRGRRWGFNERKSYSGYEVVRHFLATQQLDGRFYGQVIECGSHQNAVQMLLRGEIDGAAIDSTVLDLLYERQPELHDQVRAIAALGPSPIPPWVIGLHVAVDQREAIRRCLLEMHRTAQGQAILQRGQTLRFARVSDEDYRITRERLKLAESVIL